MYRIENTSSAIKEIQKYLSLAVRDMHVVQNGSYDSDTRAAAESFQGEVGLPMTGRIDYATFTALFERYTAERRKGAVAEAARGHLSLPVTRDSPKKDIYSVNAKIQEILKYYGAEITDYVYSIFNDEVEESIAILCEIFSLDGRKTVDDELYARIVREYSSIKKLTESNETA